MKIKEINNNTCFFNYGSEKIYLDRVIDDNRINDFSNHITLSDKSGNSLFVSLNHKNSEVRKFISNSYSIPYSIPYSSYHNTSYSPSYKNDSSISFAKNIYPFYKESLFDFNNEINDIFLNIKGNVSILFENFIFKDKKHFFEIIKNIFQNNKIISNSIFFINDEKSKISNSSIENLTTKGLIQISLSNIKNDNKDMELEDSTINNALNIKNIQGSNINIENKDEFKNLEIQNLFSQSSGEEITKISNSSIKNLITKGKVEIVLSKIKTEKEKLIIKDSELKNVKNLFIGNDNSKNINKFSIIENSYLWNLKNFQKIEGTIEILDSEIGNEDSLYKGGLIIINNKNEHIKISNSSLKEDVTVFQNAIVNNANLSGNCSIFQNSIISGDKKENRITISGYTKLFEHSQIRGIKTNISGFINIYGESNISGDATIYGNVNILDDSRISGKAELSKEEIINKYNERYS